MARGRKSGAVKDLMDLIAMFPWWAGVGLAVASYWVLHGVASRPLPAAQSAQQIGLMMTAELWQGLATAGQYVLPLICLVGSFTSVVRRRHRTALPHTTSASGSAHALQGMSWQEFELLVGEGFRRRGYSVKEVGGGGADGGVDLVLNKSGEKTFVQCKQWKAFKVGVSTVRELYGVMAAHGAAEGIVVTSGRFTQEASAFASGRNIQLIDGSALMKLLRETSGRTEEQRRLWPSSEPVPSVTPTPGVRAAPASPGQAMDPSMNAKPLCPRCVKPMVRRVAKRGAAAGKTFWGCSDFAGGCRGTREIQGT